MLTSYLDVCCGSYTLKASKYIKNIVKHWICYLEAHPDSHGKRWLSPIVTNALLNYLALLKFNEIEYEILQINLVLEVAPLAAWEGWLVHIVVIGVVKIGLILGSGCSR